MIRLLIVDDSIIFRNQIQLALKDCTDVVVVGTAPNGKAALDIMASSDIDLCILDIEMPVMDGLQTLQTMKEKGIKLKTIMFSAQSRSGAEKTLAAMELGAVDFIPKPSAEGGMGNPAEKIRDLLLPKIRSLFENRKETVRPEKVLPVSWSNFHPDVIVVASSTGGPNALVDFFAEFSGFYVPVPILVTQHMPPIFTISLAEQLSRVSGKVCLEAVKDEVICPDRIYVAPGNFHMQLTQNQAGAKIDLHQGELRNFVRPAADFLFETAARIYNHGTLGVVLTGMGRDGADGARVIKQRKGAVLIQSEESCVVFGMPGAVAAQGHADFIGNPKELARKCMSLLSSRSKSHVA